MRLLPDQATAMLLEASAGQGTIGADLDKLVPANPVCRRPRICWRAGSARPAVRLTVGAANDGHP